MYCGGDRPSGAAGFGAALGNLRVRSTEARLIAVHIDIATRCLRALVVDFWVAGVALLATAVLPATVSWCTARVRLEQFEAIARRFVPGRREATPVAAATGLFLMNRLTVLSRFGFAEFWWMHALVGPWAFSCTYYSNSTRSSRLARRSVTPSVAAGSTSGRTRQRPLADPSVRGYIRMMVRFP